VAAWGQSWAHAASKVIVVDDKDGPGVKLPIKNSLTAGTNGKLYRLQIRAETPALTHKRTGGLMGILGTKRFLDDPFINEAGGPSPTSGQPF